MFLRAGAKGEDKRSGAKLRKVVPLVVNLEFAKQIIW